MNKYQEALNVLYENVDYNDYSNQTIDRTNKAFDTLQELVDQNKTKLEAWEVVKKRLICKKYGVFKSNDCSVHNYTKICLKEIKEDEQIEEFEILNKALKGE